MSHAEDSDPKPTHQVIDFSSARAQRLDEKRRKTERIFFKHLLGIYCVTETTELKSIEVMDLSEDGCSFQIPFDSTDPWPKDLKDVSVRLYFSHDSYLPVVLKIQNSRPCIEEGVRYVRYGCLVDKTISAYSAYQQFVRFLKQYAEHSHRDTGQVTTFYL